MSADIVDADTLRTLLDGDLTALAANPSALRTTLVGALIALEAADDDVAALRKEVHLLKTRNGIRGPIADGLAALAALDANQSSQVFTGHAAGVLAATRAAAADAAAAAAASRNSAALLAHAVATAAAALEQGNAATAAATLTAAAAIPVPGPVTVDESAAAVLENLYEGLHNADNPSPAPDGELADLFG